MKKNARGNSRRDLKDIEKIKGVSRTPASAKKQKNPVEKPVLHKRSNRKKVKKKKTKFFLGRVLFLFSFIIGVIYIISIVIDVTQKPVISYQMVQRGMIDNSHPLDGLIVRNEEVILNTKEGNMYLIAGEGDKVRRQGMVYQTLDSIEASALEQDIQNLESDIEKVQVKRQERSYFQNEIKEINNNIDRSIEIYHIYSKPGDLGQAHELKKQVEYELMKRNNVHMKDKSAALNDLQSQKQDLSLKMSGNENIYTASQPGIISYYTDGFETVFTPDQIGLITPKDISQKYTKISTTENQIIGVDDPAYRIVKDDHWKLVCFAPAALAEKLEVGEKHDFVLIEDSNITFSLKVEENIPNGKNHKLVFSSHEQLDLFLNRRTISFKSLQYIHEGLKIPKSAIAERSLIKIPSQYLLASDGGKGVMKLVEGSLESVFHALNIQYEDDDGYVHILQKPGVKDGLRLGDQIINPSQADDLYVCSEVSISQGVYAVNGSITKFKPIKITAQNDEYAIVSPHSLGGLKQFDQIVTNPKNIQEEELIRNMDVKNIK